MSWMSRLFRRSARTDRERPVLFIPSSEKLPGLWPDVTNSLVDVRADVSLLPGVSTEALEELCDDYWNWHSSEDDEEVAVVRDSSLKRSAIRELAGRGLQALPWARSRLRHPRYFARQEAVWLVGELCSKHPQEIDLDAVIGELSALATRPVEEDTKEVVANSMAVGVLSKIGGPGIVPTLRRILTSPEWEQDELSWEAALILGRVLDLPFGEGWGAVAAAREWVRANPES